MLFVDGPPRVRNPKYAELGLEPMEMRIRRELGSVLPLFNVGRSVEVGAREIARIADERAGAHAPGAALHAGHRPGGEG